MYKVLLVDDEYMILAGLQKLIDWESLGMEITGTARNGKKALDYIVEHPVDIILTDVTMPVLSGIDFIREAQKIAKPFKFIIISGYQELEYVKNGMQLGASNYLLKPIDKEELYHSLEDILKDFEQTRLYNETDQLIFEGLLGKWVRNKLTQDQLTQLFANPLFNVPVESTFTVAVVQINDAKDWESAFKVACADLGRLLYFSQSETEKVFILAEDESTKVEQKLKQLNKKMEESCLFFIGKPVKYSTDLYKSYKQAVKAKKQANFYESSLTFNRYKENKMTDSVLSNLVTDLNEGIFSKNVQRISTEVYFFIHRMKNNQMDAETVKRLMYLVLVNIYLQFDAVESDKFLEKTKALFDSETFEELAAVMGTDLLPLDELKKQLLYSDLTKQVIQMIQTEYMEDLTLKSIAKTLHVNVMYLGQVFKKETGKSFSQYLNHYRINLAKELLLQTKKPVNDIANQVGYRNQGYFYRNFKDLVGCSPGEFRE